MSKNCFKTRRWRKIIRAGQKSSENYFTEQQRSIGAIFAHKVICSFVLSFGPGLSQASDTSFEN